MAVGLSMPRAARPANNGGAFGSDKEASHVRTRHRVPQD
jgi:hypothetical protein